jgi:hypothetical protein
MKLGVIMVPHAKFQQILKLPQSPLIQVQMKLGVIMVPHAKFQQILKLPNPRIQIQSNLAQKGSMNFNSNLVPNYERLQ